MIDVKELPSNADFSQAYSQVDPRDAARQVFGDRIADPNKKVVNKDDTDQAA